jgi:hypothetical protein
MRSIVPLVAAASAANGLRVNLIGDEVGERNFA